MKNTKRKLLDPDINPNEIKQIIKDTIFNVYFFSYFKIVSKQNTVKITNLPSALGFMSKLVLEESKEAGIHPNLLTAVVKLFNP